MQQHFDKANQLFVDELWTQAYEQYSLALQLEPNNPLVLDKRAAAAIKLELYQQALDDTQAALLIDQSINTSHLRRGQALFHLHNFQQAHEAFTKAKELGLDAADLWIEKTLPHLQDAKKPPIADNLKFSWVQTDQNVSVIYYAKNVDPANINVEFTPKRVRVRIVLQDNSVYESNIDLFAEIDPASSSFSSNAFKVMLSIRKLVSGHWDDLFNKQMGNVVKRENVHGRFEGPTYPTSSQKKKDWVALEKEAVKESEEEKPTGDAALNRLFQDIYSKADEDTRRAMVKSFQTSGGTVLSTNWKEVAKTNYEENISAPKGMEVKRWGKE